MWLTTIAAIKKMIAAAIRMAGRDIYLQSTATYASEWNTIYTIDSDSIILVTTEFGERGRDSGHDGLQAKRHNLLHSI